MTSRPTIADLERAAPFSTRHIGPAAADQERMLQELGYGSLEELAVAALPEAIRMLEALDVPAALPEIDVLAEPARTLAHRTARARR